VSPGGEIMEKGERVQEKIPNERPNLGPDGVFRREKAEEGMGGWAKGI